MAIVLYARVFSSEQTIDHQESQARSAGFVIDHVVADHGVSGVSTRLVERPQGRRLFDLLRSGDTLVVRWVDRLGRNYTDVVDTIREFMRRGVVIKTVINGMTFDGAHESDGMRRTGRADWLHGCDGTSAGRGHKGPQQAGIEHAMANGAKKSGARTFLGRQPSYSREQLSMVRAMLANQAVGIAAIAKEPD